MVVDPTELCLEGAEVLEVWWVIMAGISGMPSAPRSFSQCSTTWKFQLNFISHKYLISFDRSIFQLHSP